MALINPPIWLQAGSYPARSDRLAIAALMSYPGFQVDEATPLRIRQGIKPSYQNAQLKVRAAPTPNMSVIVSGGFAFIDQHDTGGTGTYIVCNDADVIRTVQPSGGAGQYRKDTVVVSVYDQEYAGDISEARIEVIQGPYAATSGATVRGTLPPNAQILADITVGPSQASIGNNHISDVRNYTVGLGGIVPVTSNIQPPRPHPGQVFYQSDGDRFVYGDGSGNVQPVLGEWLPYTPSLANINIGNGTVRAKYRHAGDHVDLQVLLEFASGTSLTGVPQFSLPVSPLNDLMRWTGDAMINPPGTFRVGQCWLYHDSTFLTVGAVNPANGGLGTFSSAGITMGIGGWITANISYATAA
ncbi:hypothetical protein ACIQ6R_06405 [Streptomyces sp. NPDC096048]|uniref:hypothetical protein n=1 Tax=Streptomyces sp. NPDC096048 TaxID=3366072 RepID=UPI00380C2A88